MKETENKRISLIVDEQSEKDKDIGTLEQRSLLERYKKPIVMILFGIVFLGCLYLIFAPKEKDPTEKSEGLNGAVPQATNASLQADKQKAYEQQLLEEKNQDQQNALHSLSDYWTEDSTENLANSTYSNNPNTLQANPNTAAINSYKNAQIALSSFYGSDQNDYQSQQLKKEVQSLKEELRKKDETPSSGNIDQQLTLMEKSYQIAAKYLPTPLTGTKQTIEKPESQKKANEKETFTAVAPISSTSISSLYREQSDSTFVSNWSKPRNSRFFSIGNTIKTSQPKNSISAVIHGTQVIIEESTVKLRLLEPVQTAYHSIPKGTILSALAKIQGSRINLKISSIETEGSIIPVDILVYDLDGQLGLYLPYTPEVNALSEVTANMSQSSGTSIMMTRSAGQQITGELGKGLLQGVSGYLSKKIRTPKVTLKDGHHVFLYSKK